MGLDELCLMNLGFLDIVYATAFIFWYPLWISVRLVFFFKMIWNIFFIILWFIWLCWVFVAACGTLSCGMQDFFFWHANSQLWHIGSSSLLLLLLLSRFSHVRLCATPFPEQGSNVGPLHCRHGVLTTGPPGKSHGLYFMWVSFLIWTSVIQSVFTLR